MKPKEEAIASCIRELISDQDKLARTDQRSFQAIRAFLGEILGTI